ncbi:MAG: type II toxin-antitoxin system HicA family toxin [Gammaproteobacteria bacterium]
MSHKHEKLIHTIFHDPISGNIHWREVISLLEHFGAKIEQHSGARVKVMLNGAEGFLHHPHHSNVLGREEIHHVREYLGRAGITPSAVENQN